MLNENIKIIRQAKGISQEELAIKLNVVRQTLSKWERGLSVPDADMLVALAEALDTPVSTLLGETVAEPTADDLRALSEKLEVLNLQFARKAAVRRRAVQVLLALLCVGAIAVFAAMAVWGSPYLNWDYADPEEAVAGTMLHGFEWLAIRLAPIVLVASLVGLAFACRRV